MRLQIALGTMAILACGVAAGIDTGQPMPRFNATTIDGRRFTNDTVKGKVVLVQIWATWCQYCRRDQPAVDAISQEFGDQRLLVLAVNAGESKIKVKLYLARSPRNVPVVLMDKTNLAALFPVRVYPYYVAVDADGKIAGELRGSGGEPALRNLLRKAGLLRGWTPFAHAPSGREAPL